MAQNNKNWQDYVDDLAIVLVGDSQVAVREFLTKVYMEVYKIPDDNDFGNTDAVRGAVNSLLLIVNAARATNIYNLGDVAKAAIVNHFTLLDLMNAMGYTEGYTEARRLTQTGN